MLSSAPYGGNSVMPTLDLEGDIIRSLSLDAREDVHMIMVFATMVCDVFHEFDEKSPSALWQSHFCTVERFCARYRSRPEVIELLDMFSIQVLHLLQKRFFSEGEMSNMITDSMRDAFHTDIQQVMCFVQTKHIPEKILKSS